jgi:hypothetical protein
MTAIEQLRALYRQFPRATELAVSPELRDQFESELVANLRYASDDKYIPFQFITERFRTITATKLPLIFRDKRLTLVEPINAA